jgi:small-conductance mechanosensitive channel
MDEWLAPLRDYATPERVISLIRAVFIMVAGLVVARLLGRWAGKLAGVRLRAPQAQLLRRAVFYGITGLVVVTALHELGFNPGVLLGAAGILTVAVGFASQTSASNLVSGLFLIAEKPFEIGDIVTVTEVTGEVLSIDLLSVKIRTFDNLFVRIPNEQVIKSTVTNRSHFPLRRVDIKIGIAYKEDMERVRGILFELADRNVFCMAEPKPLFIFSGFGDSALQFQFSVWGETANYLSLLNSMQEAIKRAFDEEGIEIPFPHRSLYAGSRTEPFPVRVVPEGAETT